MAEWIDYKEKAVPLAIAERAGHLFLSVSKNWQAPSTRLEDSLDPWYCISVGMARVTAMAVFVNLELEVLQ